MKKINKYLISVFLTVICAAMFFSVCAFAEEKVAEGALGETVTFEIYNSGSEERPSYTLRLVGTGSAVGKDTDGNILQYKTRENSVLKPYAENIVRVEVGDGIEEIGKYCLAFLPSAAEIVIPQSLVKLGSAAFQDCSSLERIILRGEENASGLNLKNITSIGAYAFSGCRAIKSVSLSEKLEGALGKHCFYDCRNLKNLTVPAGIGAVAQECFGKCTSLHYVHFLGENTAVDSNAFGDSEHVYIVGPMNGTLYGEVRDKKFRWGGEDPALVPYAPDADSVDYGSCGEGLYWQIKKNENYTEDSPKYDLYIYGEGDTFLLIDKSGKQIGYNTYKTSSLGAYLDYIVKAEIEDGVVCIGGSSFTGMTALEQIEIPRSLTELKGAAFEYCSKLSSIYLSENEPVPGVFDLSHVTSIGSYCFDGCSELEQVIFSKDLAMEKIGQETFKNCKSITTFTVPASIEMIEKKAFSGCENLAEVIFELDASIDGRAFEGCTALKTIRGLSNSNAETFAKQNDIDFLYPCRVALRYVGSKKLIENIDVIAGQSLNSFEVGGDVCLLYNDPEGKEIYTMTPISETTTLYVKPIYSLDALTLRTEGDFGLRASFSLSSEAESDVYKISEVGALASKDRGTSGAEIDISMSRIFKAAFVKEGELTSSHISLPLSGDRFSFCATGFEDENGYPIAERCAEKLYFRGYLVLENGATGEKYTFYTEMKGCSLYELAKSAESGVYGAYSSAEIGNMKDITALDAGEKQIMSRGEMLEMVEKIELGEMERLLSGSPEIEDIEFFDDLLAEEYEKNGDVPALMRFDVRELFKISLGNEENLKALSEDIVEYAKEGGSIMLYLRPGNPSNPDTTGGRLSAQEWEYVMSELTPYQENLLDELGKTGMLLQFLKEEGVTVFVNLLPEIETENRWWCAPSEKGGDTEAAKARYIELWKFCTSYLKNDCALDNIIFVYESGDDGAEYFPGSDYVDVSGSAFESSGGKLTLSKMK